MKRVQRILACIFICAAVLNMMSGIVHATESGVSEAAYCTNEHTMARVLQSRVSSGAWDDPIMMAQIECLDGCILEANFAPTFFVNGTKYENLSEIELEAINEMIPHNMILRFKGNEIGQITEITFDTTGEPFLGTMVFPTEDGVQVQVALENVTGNCKVYIAGYREKRLVEMEPIAYTGQDIMSATFTEEMDEMKIMAWEDEGKLTPLCPAETITFE